jgi:hypothetical protein
MKYTSNIGEPQHAQWQEAVLLSGKQRAELAAADFL